MFLHSIPPGISLDWFVSRNWQGGKVRLLELTRRDAELPCAGVALRFEGCEQGLVSYILKITPDPAMVADEPHHVKCEWNGKVIRIMRRRS